MMMYAANKCDLWSCAAFEIKTSYFHNNLRKQYLTLALLLNVLLKLQRSFHFSKSYMSVKFFTVNF